MNVRANQPSPSWQSGVINLLITFSLGGGGASDPTEEALDGASLSFRGKSRNVLRGNVHGAYIEAQHLTVHMGADGQLHTIPYHTI